MLQLIVTLLIYLVMVIPVGTYLYHIMVGKHTFSDPVFDRIDQTVYRVAGIHSEKQMDWKQYAGTLILTNAGFHGLSQVLYEFASSTANNDSSFEGLADNTLFWNMTTGFAMFFGRYLPIVIQLATVGSLMKKRYVNESVGTLRRSTVSFAVVLVFVVYIFAALTFLPALALEPIAEHLTLWG